MSYLNVISLERAKNYLRLDTDMVEDDSEIISMINAACLYVEKRTNHIFYAREISYFGACQTKVYDFPINAVIEATNPFVAHYATFDLYPDAKTVLLNVGYALGEVPDDLVQSCLQMIKVFYYESEKQVNSTLIPESVKQVIDVYRRFI